ncbi:unnamed protein product [Rhizophagus irregularis]|nr:unnamed protein product [Rhizophagus irregularis]
MNPQVQSKEKTSTKRVNTSNTDFADAHRLSKKKQQHTLSQQQYDPQLYSLTNTSFQQQNLNLSPLEIEQDKKDEGKMEKEEDYDQNQNPSDEKSGSKWKHDEIKVLLDYIQENYSAWSKGNKSKFYNDMAKSVLPNKESSAIKSKFARLTKKYESIKKHNNQTGKEWKDWYWFDKMDKIFRIRENISPSVLANKETGTGIEEEIEIKKENCKNKNPKIMLKLWL